MMQGSTGPLRQSLPASCCSWECSLGRVSQPQQRTAPQAYKLHVEGQESDEGQAPCEPLPLQLGPNTTIHLYLSASVEKKPVAYTIAIITLACQYTITGIAAVLATAMVYASLKRLSGDIRAWCIGIHFVRLLVTQSLPGVLRLAAVWISVGALKLWVDACQAFKTVKTVKTPPKQGDPATPAPSPAEVELV